MFYVFHNKQLLFQVDKLPSILPDDTYILANTHRMWLYKHKSRAYRPIAQKHVPKEIKLLCLLLNIPFRS